MQRTVSSCFGAIRPELHNTAPAPSNESGRFPCPSRERVSSFGPIGYFCLLPKTSLQALDTELKIREAQLRYHHEGLPDSNDLA